MRRRSKYNSEIPVDCAEEVPLVTAVQIDGFVVDPALQKASQNSGGGNKSKSGGGTPSSVARNDSSAKISGRGLFLSEESARNLVATAAVGSKPKRWPKKLQREIVECFARPINEKACREYLTRNKWPVGLQAGLIKSCQKFPIRFFIVDDSGSMCANDGRRVVTSGSRSSVIDCSRWAELIAGLEFHAELSERALALSEFRLLNGSDPIIVGLGDDNGEGLQLMREAFADSPRGQTPLCEHIECVIEDINSVADELRQLGKKAVIIISTDGEATDGDVANAMRPLKSLPVWVVLRLCTNEQKVIDYWNSIDKELELELDVLDDLTADASEVNQFNSWLTYGEPLHRFREFGALVKEFDLIDEQPLSGDQIRIVCHSIISEDGLHQFPHPAVDWNEFARVIQSSNQRQGKIFCTVNEKDMNWIDADKLKKIFSARRASVSGGGGASPAARSSACVVS